MEQSFDDLTLDKFKSIAEVHWSSFSSIQMVVDFLDRTDSTNILDIGSGIGKFCILGAKLTNIHFTGVEIRESLHKEAVRILKKYALENVTLIHDDIKNLDFSPFDAFYYYNPFCEHIATNNWIEKSDFLEEDKYYEYEDIVLQKLEQKETGTIVILHYAKTLFLSENYQLLDIQQDGEITFWKKIK